MNVYSELRWWLRAAAEAFNRELYGKVPAQIISKDIIKLLHTLMVCVWPAVQSYSHSGNREAHSND